MNSKYLAIVQTPKDLDYNPVIRINIGGPTKQCVNICVYSTSKIAYLAGVGYDSMCSINEALEKGPGTRDLVSTSISFVFQQYPRLEGINLKDASKVKCANRKYMSLPLLSIVTSGKTWYEKYFGAKLEEKTQRDKLTVMKTTLKTTAIPAIPSSILAHKETVLEVYMKCHRANSTYFEFFKALKQGSAAAAADCSIFTENNWLHAFLSSIPGCDYTEWLDAFWLIKRRRAETWPPVTIKKQGKTTTVASHFAGGSRDFKELRLTPEDL